LGAPSRDAPSGASKSWVLILAAHHPTARVSPLLHRKAFLPGSSITQSIKLKEISRYYMRGKSIGVIADLLGRSDTYEFNRLLHEHTSYSQVGFFQISANAAIPEEIIRIALRDLKPKVS
jgi:hypothetical protein